mgnify:CR=1 FL=1
MSTINLTINDETELYNRFDAQSDYLSEDVKTYITNRLADRNFGEKVEINVISSKQVDEDRITRAFNKWVDDEDMAVKKEFRKNFIQQIWMFAIGVTFIALSLFLENKIGVVWFTVLSTIGAFSMWEAASIWIIQNPKLRLRKRIIKKIRSDTVIKIKTIID